MKKVFNFSRIRTIVLLCSIVIAMPFVVSCSDDNSDDVSVSKGTKNPAVFIKSEEKWAVLNKIKDIDGMGRLYEMNYTVDYKLDEALNANISSTKDLLKFVQQHLYDSVPSNQINNEISFIPGCSAFAVPDKADGKFLMGRNYDFCHTKTIDGVKTYVPIAAFVIHTAPVGGKKSIAFADGLNFGFTQGCYSDGKTDISLLMGLPYAILDGINEDGFAIGVLSLNEPPTTQNDASKKNISTTVAIRMLLDRASTVKEAIQMLEQYNMRMKNTDDAHNYHFFMADATGDYAIVEYTRDPNNPAETHPTRMEVLTDNDTLRCVTNFYVSPTMVGTNDGWGSEHGKERYFNMRTVLSNNNYLLGSDEAMSLLRLVSQGRNDADPTSFTQWSALYNLSKKSIRLAILRDYGKEYNFKIK